MKLQEKRRELTFIQRKQRREITGTDSPLCFLARIIIIARQRENGCERSELVCVRARVCARASCFNCEENGGRGE